ncbi:hypothetical protein [Gilliamella sp. Imp1-1]|uniref:hypothetical protein n=1 Tax=Gilliamella sp. Imp1-1 TaxID=3120248 RepID=UPI0004618BC4|nr:hypothetical protein [Gilliamella apicola]KDN11135.1 hypothetical protein GAPWKB30_0341 [Gilliamella apicola]OCG56809.1 hypothetical protein A9G38_09470 [Gilliamella apicola]
MSEKITFVVSARIGPSYNEVEIEVDKAEYEAAEDKNAYEQELVDSYFPDLVEIGIGIKE